MSRVWQFIRFRLWTFAAGPLFLSACIIAQVYLDVFSFVFDGLIETLGVTTAALLTWACLFNGVYHFGCGFVRGVKRLRKKRQYKVCGCGHYRSAHGTNDCDGWMAAPLGGEAVPTCSCTGFHKR